MIDLWASKGYQLDYQNNVPMAQVSAELFCQWEDFYFPDSADFKQAFDYEELIILAEFDKTLNDMVNKTPQNLPLIDEFIETEEWKIMNAKAIELKKKLDIIGINDLLTPGRNLKINGHKVWVAGEHADNGVYFVNQTLGESMKVDPTDIAINNPSELMIVIPALAAGTYKLQLTTQFSASSLLKEPRTVIFDKVLTVQ